MAHQSVHSPRATMDNLASFNINYNVHVRLTEEGRNILHSQKVTVPPEDQNGYSRWQLWVLMNTFGPHLWNGAPVPFEPTIRLAVD
jgi:hypothetical protein